MAHTEARQGLMEKLFAPQVTAGQLRNDKEFVDHDETIEEYRGKLQLWQSLNSFWIKFSPALIVIVCILPVINIWVRLFYAIFAAIIVSSMFMESYIENRMAFHDYQRRRAIARIEDETFEAKKTMSSFKTSN